jgi:hypothetical protein
MPRSRGAKDKDEESKNWRAASSHPRVAMASKDVSRKKTGKNKSRLE